MKKLLKIMMLLMIIISSANIAYSKEASPMQFLYMVKQIFPENSEIAVFMSKETVSTNEKSLQRAAAQTQTQPKLYVIENSSDIGKRLRELKKNTILILFESELMMKKNSMMYILSKCKENEILLVTSSQEYSDLGALLGLIYNKDNQLQVVINLKHNLQLKPKFSEEFIQVAGISKVIE